jgi:DNA-binding MarR family transcriptional regulator
MSETNIAFFSGRLVDFANRFIASELVRRGVEGIVPSHGDILCALFEEDGLPVSEIARRTHRTKSTICVLASKLEGNGYVERRPDPADRRAVGLWLTEKARGLKPVFEAISSDLADRITQSLSPEEAIVLGNLLARVVRNWKD